MEKCFECGERRPIGKRKAGDTPLAKVCAECVMEFARKGVCVMCKEPNEIGAAHKECVEESVEESVDAEAVPA